MPKFMCSECEKIYDNAEMPVQCACGCMDIIEMIPSDASAATVEERNELKTVGFRASPSKIRQMFKIAALDKGANNFEFPSFVLTQTEAGVFINEVGKADTIYVFAQFYPKYFEERWGSGRIPFESEMAMKYINLMRQHESCSVHLDTSDKKIVFYAGKKDVIAKRALNDATIKTSPEKPTIKFNAEAFMPVLKDAEYGKYYFTTHVTRLREIVKKAESFGMDYYPFTFSPDGVSVGTGDMKNPIDGAFNQEISVADYKPQETTVRVEIADKLDVIVKNVNTLVNVYFAGDHNPLWITGEIIDPESNEPVGRFGYVVPPRVSAK